MNLDAVLERRRIAVEKARRAFQADVPPLEEWPASRKELIRKIWLRGQRAAKPRMQKMRRR